MSYIEWLRRHIGPRKIVLIYSTVVVQDPTGRVLLQRRSDFDWWGLPGGILEKGEDILSCARRELREETGLEIDGLRLVGLYTHPRYDVVYPNGDAVQQFTVCFAGQTDGYNLHPDGAESLALAFVAPDQLSGVTIPLWYRAMIADVVDGSAATFEPIVIGRAAPKSEAMGDSLWHQPDSIMPAAVAVVRRADGRIYLPRGADGQPNLPWRPMALGETVATTAVRAATIPGCEPTRLVGIVSQPGRVAGFAGPTGPTDHIVAGVFLVNTTAGVDGPVSDGDWRAPADLAGLDSHQQAALLTWVVEALDGGVFVDDYREPARV